MNITVNDIRMMFFDRETFVFCLRVSEGKKIYREKMILSVTIDDETKLSLF